MLRRLAKDRSGNTLALLAAAILPLLGLVGSGVDMGRAYLVSARLQQACDAGVLAARKKFGTEPTVTGTIPAGTADMGQRFFNTNFRDGMYGSANRDFTMTLEGDFAISGTASADVPTSVMNVFGFDNVPVDVECEAVLNVTALDIMMVLDVTGSMRKTNDGDSQSRIDALKQTIRSFHGQIEGAKAPAAVVRYGFVPYATNVNVGHLLEDSWVASQWLYQTREDTGLRMPVAAKTIWRNWQYVSGERTPWTIVSTYEATWVPPVRSDEEGYYRCDGAQPSNDWTYTDTVESTATDVAIDPPGVETIEYTRRVQNGTRYGTWRNGTTCEVKKSIDTDYVETYEKVTFVPAFDKIIYEYDQFSKDVSNWRSETTGCIEERATTQITDYTNVDFSQNLDLDIDLVPTAGDPDTQWKPRYPEIIYSRSIRNNGSGDFTTRKVRTDEEYAQSGSWWFSNCPAQAQKLQEMTAEEVDSYLATLAPMGATYHDIGMIWGARLISPTGIFASENADQPGEPKSRHLVFLTDGQTEPYDLAYGAYGVDGLDQRRWDSDASLTLAETIEARFGVACSEVRKRNVTVWVIAFGTNANQAMIDCAGAGRYFEASNAAELNDAFTAIAKSVGDLRLSQ